MYSEFKVAEFLLLVAVCSIGFVYLPFWLPQHSEEMIPLNSISTEPIEFTYFNNSQILSSFVIEDLLIPESLPIEDQWKQNSTDPFKFFKYSLYFILVSKVGTIGTLGIYLLFQTKHKLQKK